MSLQRSRLPTTNLTVAHGTVGGFRRSISFAERVAAAQAGGANQIGWWVQDYLAELAKGRTAGELRRIADDAGVRVVEIEFLRGWTGLGTAELLGGLAKPMSWSEQENYLFEMADAFGADHVNVGDDGVSAPILAWPELVERFDGICQRAAEHGLLVMIEPMPWTFFSNLADGWRLIEASSQRNCALLLDTWHYFRGSGNEAALAALPPDAIGLIQLDDAGPPEGPPLEDTMYRRRFPGEGDFDLPRLFEVLNAKGVRVPVCVEVMGDVVDALDPAEAVRRARETATRVLEPAGWM